MKRISYTLMLLLVVLMAHAQLMNPVHFTSELKKGKGTEAELVFAARIDRGWHVYATDLGQDGPIEATLNVVKLSGAELVGKLQSVGNVVKKYDAMFGMELRYFEQTAMFVQKIRFTKPDYDIDCYLEYGACNDRSCLPPTQVELKAQGKSGVKAAESLAPTPQEKAEEKQAEPQAAADTAVAASQQQTDTLTATSPGLWKGVRQERAAEQSPASMPWWLIFLEGLLGGFVALFTPCVWPIIPMTVSFFLKRNKEQKKAVGEAITYGLSIVVIYVLLGLVVTLLFGASALNALSTNAVFNIFFALLLVVFAASFFGAFELTLPSSWTNKIDQKSEKTSGLLAIFLMAFTLALVSFSCTGPIIGFLLVAVSVQGSIVAPAIGMLGFAIALAIPFTLFALFPSWLKRAPKSGSWMNTVKVTLGFIELAFALKFFSVADLAYGWHLLDREVFIVLWIVIFALLGVYLLGWLKFPNDDEGHRTNVPQFFLAMGSLAFALYMVPGLWGAPLKAISAFTPPMNTQDFSLYKGTVEAKYKDFDAGMAAAVAEGKPVLIDFTGFGCVNCRKMEAAVWTDPQVQDLINNKYVLISLYVDDKTPLPQPINVMENGQQRTLRTVGDRWSYLQRTRVGQNTQPCYVLLNPKTEEVLAPLRSYDENIGAYVDFLKSGLTHFR